MLPLTTARIAGSCGSGSSASPLAEAYRRLSGSHLTLEVGTSPPQAAGGPLWRGADLATPEGFDEAARRHGEGLEHEHGRSPRRYLAPTLVLDEYAWCVAVALVGPYLAAGIVVKPQDLGVDVRFADDRCRVWVRPASLRTVDEARAPADREAITSTFHHLLAPVVEQATRAAGRRLASMWRSAADMIAVGAWSAGEALGDEHAGAALGDALLSAARAPLTARGGFRTVIVKDAPVLTRVRTECCFFYTLTDRSCVTCPRTSDTERSLRLAALSPSS